MKRWRLGTADLLAGCDGLGARTAWVKPGASAPRGMVDVPRPRRGAHGSGGSLDDEVDRVIAAIECWLDDPCTRTVARLVPMGPAFHRACWIAATGIEPGTTVTYSGLARAARRPAASRAAAQAMARNRLAPLVPCHRVVAAGGLGGFLGCSGSPGSGAWPLRVKRWLLAREGLDDTR